MRPFISGDRVYLRMVQEEELFGPYMDWFHDDQVTHHMVKGAFPLTPQQQRSYFEQVINSSNNLVLAIVNRSDDVHIGNVGLHGIDWIHRVAELGIIIGESQYWGQGLAAEAIRLICRHGFAQLQLNRIELGVLETHHAAIRLYEKMGFQREGLKRNHIYKHGQYVNVVLMGMLKGELT